MRTMIWKKNQAKMLKRFGDIRPNCEKCFDPDSDPAGVLKSLSFSNKLCRDQWELSFDIKILKIGWIVSELRRFFWKPLNWSGSWSMIRIKIWKIRWPGPIVDASCQKISGRSTEQFQRSCPQKKCTEEKNNNNNTHEKTNGTNTIRFPWQGILIIQARNSVTAQPIWNPISPLRSLEKCA